MNADAPLPTLLSQLLVAYTIEFDDAYEERVPHFTTVGRYAGIGPQSVWLVSMAMWSDFMRHVPDEGVTIAHLGALARKPTASMKSTFGGMERWNYVRPARSAGATTSRRPGFGSAKGVRDEWLVMPTSPGKRAQEIWKPLGAEIDGRWEKRFGKAAIAALRASLRKLPGASDGGLPRYVAVVGPQNGFASKIVRADAAKDDSAGADLSVLLSRVLLTFTLEYESEASVSLPLAANLLRSLEEGPVRVGELMIRTGLAKEGVDGSLSVLSKRGLVMVEPTAKDGKGKSARLTEPGVAAVDEYKQGVTELERSWTRKLGAGVVDDVRTSLSAIVAHPTGLAETVTPHEGGWRTHKVYAERTAAFIAKPAEALPWHPMVSHRGGYPDGA
jgi:DNA-binding MarR family transcriptional regulator